MMGFANLVMSFVTAIASVFASGDAEFQTPPAPDVGKVPTLDGAGAGGGADVGVATEHASADAAAAAAVDDDGASGNGGLAAAAPLGSLQGEARASLER